MAETPDAPELANLPRARVAAKRRLPIPLVWVVPIVALVIGAWLAWKAISATGPTFVISFATAEGIEAGKTKIKYKSVDVGLVESVALSPDRSAVLVHARMQKYAGDYLVEDSRFWVVRPRVTGSTVQGLGTLLSGSYIGMDVGSSSTARYEFKGLEEQPLVTSDVPGRRFALQSETLGSINVGSPVYFRKLAVGEVESYRLDQDGGRVLLRVFVKAPYDQYVNARTRFWEASGIDLKLDAAGVSINTESVASILIGGIVFQTRGDAKGAEPATEDTVFRLFANRETALAHEDISIIPFAFRFRESLRGLSVGAPVDFRGIVIGEVTDIRLQWVEAENALFMVAFADIYPDRFTSREVGHDPRRPQAATGERRVDQLVQAGLRGQLRTGNLLTGQVYIALDMFRGARPDKVGWSEQPPTFPTMPGILVGLEESLAEITKKLAKVPFDEIGADVRRTLTSLDRTLGGIEQLAAGVDRDVRPELREAIVELRKTLTAAERSVAQDAPLQQDLREALREVSRAAASLRALTDYLEQNPEALIRGRPEDKP